MDMSTITAVSTRKGREAVREIVREIAEDHAYDPYGSGMLALEAVTEALWIHGQYVPAEIATFSVLHRAGENGQDIADRIECDEFDTEDVTYFMYVLSRYIDVVRLAGRDY